MKNIQWLQISSNKNSELCIDLCFDLLQMCYGHKKNAHLYLEHWDVRRSCINKCGLQTFKILKTPQNRPSCEWPTWKETTSLHDHFSLISRAVLKWFDCLQVSRNIRRWLNMKKRQLVKQHICGGAVPLLFSRRLHLFSFLGGHMTA